MGDKKKNRDKSKQKKKDKKKKDKDDKKKSKKQRYSSDSDQSRSSSSDRSKSIQKQRKKSKSKSKSKAKGKKDKKQKLASTPQISQTSNNNPYDFKNIMVTPTFIGKGPIMPNPPPAPYPTPSVIPKPKSKQPNIFKLLPKLPYGAVLFGKTLFSSEYLNENVCNKTLIDMCKSIDIATKQQNKKVNNQINRCMNDIQKIISDQTIQNSKPKSQESAIKQKNNRYQIITKIYNQCLQKYQTIVP